MGRPNQVHVKKVNVPYTQLNNKGKKKRKV